MPKADAASVAAVAQGLEDADETTLIIGNPDPEPVNQGASAPATTTASTPKAAGEVDKADEVAEEDETQTPELPVVGDDDDVSEENLEALKELRDRLREEATREVEESLVPKLTSSYDRQIAALNKQIQASQEQAATREKTLRDELRQAQLNGLSDAEKTELQKRWDWEDRVQAVEARERELTDYHVEILRTAYAQEYAEFGLTAEDLEEFDTPEQMDEFVQAVQLEYYKQLAELRASGALPAENKTQTVKDQPAKKKTAPAGATAPTDAGGGGATPQPSKFNVEQSRAAMADNIRGGWETVQLR